MARCGWFYSRRFGHVRPVPEPPHHREVLYYRRLTLSATPRPRLAFCGRVRLGVGILGQPHLSGTSPTHTHSHLATKLRDCPWYTSLRCGPRRAHDRSGKRRCRTTATRVERRARSRLITRVWPAPDPSDFVVSRALGPSVPPGRRFSIHIGITVRAFAQGRHGRSGGLVRSAAGIAALLATRSGTCIALAGGFRATQDVSSHTKRTFMTTSPGRDQHDILERRVPVSSATTAGLFANGDLHRRCLFRYGPAWAGYIIDWYDMNACHHTMWKARSYERPRLPSHIRGKPERKGSI